MYGSMECTELLKQVILHGQNYSHINITGNLFIFKLRFFTTQFTDFNYLYVKYGQRSRLKIKYLVINWCESRKYVNIKVVKLKINYKSPCLQSL